MLQHAGDADSGLLIGGTEIDERVLLAVSVTLAGGTLIGITR